jgi:2',3'-cyclic-nucleotide 2'-phosphodiesterase (5'-nucleotidase family)
MQTLGPMHIKTGLLPVLLTALSLQHAANAQQRDTLCFLQINDIYEIAPLQGGRIGGIARIATVIDEHRRRYPTTVFVAGDFLSPSLMGTAVVDKERLSGKQIVDLFNRVGVDVVTFGNHEFDIGEAPLQRRIDESSFQWVSGNVRRNDGSPFHRNRNGAKEPFPTYIRIDAPNGRFSVGLFSLTLPSNRPPYTKFLPYAEALQANIPTKLGKREMLAGLTHLSLAEDMELLRQDTRIRLIMGGHEHENIYKESGKGHVAKADANGKTVYRHLIWREGRRGFGIRSTLLPIDESVAAKPEVADAVKAWEDRAYTSFRNAGFEPTRTVVTVTDTLNGMENSIRYRQNSLGRAVTLGLMTGGDAEASFINSGSVRIDDIVTGTLTELDVIRIMPFGGRVVELTLKGDLLLRILQDNEGRKGLGGYLQLHEAFSQAGGAWQLHGKPIAPGQAYRIRTIEYLAQGNENGLEFLNPKNPSYLRSVPVMDSDGKPLDIRKGLIEQLSRQYGG